MNYRFAAACLLSLSLAALAAGQERRRDFQYFVETHPHLTVSNGAVLSFLECAPISMASLSFDKGNGGLIPLEGSPDDWKASAATESFWRVSDRLSFYGKLGYSHFRGKDMGGTVLMDPSYNPIGFLEEDYSARGTKKRETYSLAGSIAYALSEPVTLGFAANYTSADQVKYKDPRFQNVWMDMSLRPGAMFRLSPRFAMGVNLEYRHTLEKISAKLFGTVDHDYYMLVDQGNFYGSRERFEGDAGYISVTNERPLSHSFYGLSLQAIATRGESRYCGELKAYYHNGSYGNRSSTSVVFCEFKGPEVSYTGSFVHPEGRNLHKMGLEASFSMVDNFTNTYKHEVEMGMTGKIVYLGQSQTFSKSDIRAGVSYAFFGDTSSGYLPAWELKARAGAVCKLQQTKIYPFNRDWTSVAIDCCVSGGRHFALNKNVFSVLASASFLSGFGDPRKDKLASGAVTTMRSFDDYSNRQFEYETASRLGVGVELEYARIISQKLIPYIKLSNLFCSLLAAPEYLDGGNRNVAGISLGCSF